MEAQRTLSLPDQNRYDKEEMEDKKVVSSHEMMKEKIAQTGKLIYSQQIREKVEPEHNGKYLVIDITNGHYEIDSRHITAARRVRANNPAAVLYGLRIGSATLGRL